MNKVDEMLKKKNDLNHDKWVGLGGKFENDIKCLLNNLLFI